MRTRSRAPVRAHQRARYGPGASRPRGGGEGATAWRRCCPSAPAAGTWPCWRRIWRSSKRARAWSPAPSRILPIVTETAASLFGLGTYAADAGPRLCGMFWGGEDLAADIGAKATVTRPAATRRLPARALATLLGATAAQVPAIDAVYTNFRDPEGLKAEAARSGYATVSPRKRRSIPTRSHRSTKRSRLREAEVAHGHGASSPHSTASPGAPVPSPSTARCSTARICAPRSACSRGPPRKRTRGQLREQRRRRSGPQQS